MRLDLSPGIDALFDAMDRRAWGGLGRLAGDFASPLQDGRAKVMNEPARVQVTILEAVTFTVVARTTSRPNGVWQVLYLDPTRRYTVIGSDWTMSVNSAIQDWVQPAPMDP